MLTSNGEKVLNKPVGKIEEGYEADLIVLDPKQNLVPSYDPKYTVVNMANSGNVDSVIVNGNILMEEGKVVSLDEEKILQESKDLEKELRDEIEALKSNLLS